MYRSSKRHGVNINMKQTFFEVKNFFFQKRIKQTQSLICSKNYEINNFLAIVELCAFYIHYKKLKLAAINFHGRTNVNFMQTQPLRFCKDTANVSCLPLLKKTTKSTHFFPAKKKIPILWIELQTNKIQKVPKPYI